MFQGLLLCSCIGGRVPIRDFRANYTDYNTLLHSDTAHTPFLKAHMKNGSVIVFEQWTVDTTKRAILD